MRERMRNWSLPLIIRLTWTLSLSFTEARLSSSHKFALIPSKRTRQRRLVNGCANLAMSSSDTSSTTNTDKKVVFIRHGCTHMNEYLSSNPFGSPGFTDIFKTDEHLYRDSPLSPRGVRQAQGLANRLGECPEYGPLLREVDLIVVSPLTRAIQTLEIGLLPHIQSAKHDAPTVPILALPHAAERLYLISDVGKRRQELHEQYGHIVDFHHDGFDKEDWWFQHVDENEKLSGMATQYKAATLCLSWRAQ